MHDFDDFGIDFCPIPEKIFPYTDPECKRKTICDNEKANIVVPRYYCSRPSISAVHCCLNE